MSTPEPIAKQEARQAVPRDEALAIARAVLAPIRPLLHVDDAGKPYGCITGSIRRQCPTVNDIDAVIIPAPGTRLEIQRHLFNHSKRVLCRGDVKTSVLISDGLGGCIQMDLWFARCRETDGSTDLFAAALPSNWGTMLLYSTGSKEHNVRIATAAKARGWHWHQFAGLDCGPDPMWPEAGNKVISQTEEAIYAALEMDYIPPQERR